MEIFIFSPALLYNFITMIYNYQAVYFGDDVLNIQIYGKAKCFDTKKAERYFKERRIKYQFVDLVKFGMSKGEFNNILKAVGDFDELLDKSSKAYENSFIEYLATKEAKEEKDYIDGYSLDVDRLVFGELLLSMPGKVLCKDDCKGLCPVCGTDLNVTECDCEKESLDPRMSVFKDILNNFKEV